MSVFTPNCATCNHPEWKHFGDLGDCQHLTAGGDQCTCPGYQAPQA